MRVLTSSSALYSFNHKPQAHNDSAVPQHDDTWLIQPSQAVGSGFSRYFQTFSYTEWRSFAVSAMYLPS